MQTQMLLIACARVLTLMQAQMLLMACTQVLTLMQMQMLQMLPVGLKSRLAWRRRCAAAVALCERFDFASIEIEESKTAIKMGIIN